MKRKSKAESKAIQAAIDLGAKSNAAETQKQALLDAYQHGWNDCAAEAASKKVTDDAEAERLAAEAAPAAKRCWWQQT